MLNIGEILGKVIALFICVTVIIVLLILIADIGSK